MPHTVEAAALKVTIPLRASQIPKDLVPPEPAPAGNPVLLVQLQGCTTPIPAALSGRNARRTLKSLVGQPEDTNLALGGTLVPGVKSGTWQITNASLQVFAKQQPAAEPAP